MNDFDLTIEGQTAVQVYDDIYQRKPVNKIQVYPDEMLVRIVRDRFRRLGIKDVLDAGCGEGRNALMMAAEGLNVTCLDTSTHALELAKNQASVRNLELNFHQSSITSLPFADETFDAIICWRVLYYLPLNEAKSVMSKFMRTLRPGGCVYISIPTPEYNYSNFQTDLTREMILGDNGVFGRRYKEDELSVLMDGFVEIEYGIQAQSFLGRPHLIQSFWHVFGRKPF